MWLLSLITDFLYQIWFLIMLGFRNTKFTLKRLRVCLIMDFWSWRQAQRVLANTWSKDCCCCCSRVQLFVTPWTAARQASCPSASPRACSNSCPSSRWCHPTFSSSVIFSSCLRSSPALGSFLWVGSLHQVAKVLEFQLQHQSFQWILRTDFL